MFSNYDTIVNNRMNSDESEVPRYFKPSYRDISHDNCCGLLAIILVSAVVGLPIPITEIIMAKVHDTEIICPIVAVSLQSWMIIYGIISIVLIIITDVLTYYKLIYRPHIDDHCENDCEHFSIALLFATILICELFWLGVGTINLIKNFESIQPHSVRIIFAISIGASYGVLLVLFLTWIIILLHRQRCRK